MEDAANAHTAEPLDEVGARGEERMSNNLDFEFGFGSGRYLKGRGWRGILALALLLCALVNALWASGSTLTLGALA